MLKIFGKIRQKLLQDNKTGSYLKYATGEVLLVVIGILIAFQVNNWNEQRKNRMYEVTMLEEVQRELINDSENIKNLIPYLKSVQHSFRELAVMKNDHDHNLDSLDIHLLRVRGYGITLKVNKSPFEAIKSAGLDRISNQDIRNNLSSLYGYHIESIEEWINEVLRVELFTRNEIVFQLFDPVAVPDDDGGVSTQLIIENPLLLFKNPKFDELLFRSSWPLTSTIRRLTFVKERMESLSEQIDQELKK